MKAHKLMAAIGVGISIALLAGCSSSINSQTFTSSESDYIESDLTNIVSKNGFKLEPNETTLEEFFLHVCSNDTKCFIETTIGLNDDLTINVKELTNFYSIPIKYSKYTDMYAARIIVKPKEFNFPAPNNYNDAINASYLEFTFSSKSYQSAKDLKFTIADLRFLLKTDNEKIDKDLLNKYYKPIVSKYGNPEIYPSGNPAFYDYKEMDQEWRFKPDVDFIDFDYKCFPTLGIKCHMKMLIQYKIL